MILETIVVKIVFRDIHTLWKAIHKLDVRREGKFDELPERTIGRGISKPEHFCKL